MLSLIGMGALWLLIIIVFFVLTEQEKGGSATLLILVILAVLNFGLGVPIITFTLANPGIAFLVVVGYFVVGTLWMLIKWRWYVKKKKREYNAEKLEFFDWKGLKLKATDPIPEKYRKEWKDKVTRYSSELEYNPQVRKHKWSIYTWISCWPFSMIWTVINDPVRRIVVEIYNLTYSWLQSMSDKTFEDTKVDFEEPTDAGK